MAGGSKGRAAPAPVLQAVAGGRKVLLEQRANWHALLTALQRVARIDPIGDRRMDFKRYVRDHLVPDHRARAEIVDDSRSTWRTLRRGPRVRVADDEAVARALGAMPGDAQSSAHDLEAAADRCRA